MEMCAAVSIRKTNQCSKASSSLPVKSMTAKVSKFALKN